MSIDQQVIDLATRIQRRRDFSAHVTGMICGAVILGVLVITGINGTGLYLTAMLTWATALSLQHFRHILRGPVTADAVRAEAARRGRDSRPNDTAPVAHESLARMSRRQRAGGVP
jgi:hypothetical protein